MLALHRAGLEIPAAMSVTGFDDTPMSEIIWPPLTTVQQPIKYFGERAVQLLVDSQSGAKPRYVAVEHQLIIRESTGAPNKFRGA